MAASSYPLPHHVRPIGVPYQGTHGRQFNQSGGSDNWQSENAVDLPAPKGTPIYAVADGTIGSRIGSLGSGGRFAGLRVYVDTPTNQFYYAHLSRLVVKAGQHVHAGQLLGYSGVANGVAHLHFAAKNGDPRNVFGGTLPTGDTNVPTSTAAPAADQTSATVDAQQIYAPQSPAPPTALGTPGPDVELPGSVDYTTNPHAQVASMWQQVAQSSPFVSPDTAALLRNAQLAAGVTQ